VREKKLRETEGEIQNNEKLSEKGGERKKDRKISEWIPALVIEGHRLECLCYFYF